MAKKTSPKVSPIGQSFDNFLNEQGIAEAVQIEAQMRVMAWMIEQQRKKIGLTKAALAKEMATSRSQLDRILHPETAAVTVEVLDRAARAVGLRLKIDLEPIAA
ncbi:MAG: helix-turn-helix domain-containing protein [Ferrovibrio sp.]|uniref:helix-turn-helix domain-containing protein n=1 Tax=Ferrovibrio sp. TaxID=1917215 RepID=UPI00391A2552